MACHNKISKGLTAKNISVNKAEEEEGLRKTSTIWRTNHSIVLMHGGSLSGLKFTKRENGCCQRWWKVRLVVGVLIVHTCYQSRKMKHLNEKGITFKGYFVQFVIQIEENED